jgi:2-hydroxy-6-oxonona-2,4-dienedioate hydrolase
MQLLITQVKKKKAPQGDVATENIILLHGLLGNLNNWEKVKQKFGKRHKVWVPELPLFDVTLTSHLDKLVIFLAKYIAHNQIKGPILVGNSLGGHVALLYILKHPGTVKKLVLTGSSGLYENTLGVSFPRIKDYQYIKNKVSDVFDRKEVVDEAMVKHVFNIVQHKMKVLALIGLARDAQKQNLKNELPLIKVPTLLVWGLQDVVTPPEVGKQFYDLLPNAKLHYLNHCGHAPMMEQPELFNDFLEKFLKA